MTLDDLERRIRSDRHARLSTEQALALIARIRELDAKLVEVRDDLRDGCLGQREIDALLDKGVVIP